MEKLSNMSRDVAQITGNSSTATRPRSTRFYELLLRSDEINEKAKVYRSADNGRFKAMRKDLQSS